MESLSESWPRRRIPLGPGVRVKLMANTKNMSIQENFNEEKHVRKQIRKKNVLGMCWRAALVYTNLGYIHETVHHNIIFTKHRPSPQNLPRPSSAWLPSKSHSSTWSSHASKFVWTLNMTIWWLDLRSLNKNTLPPTVDISHHDATTNALREFPKLDTKGFHNQCWHQAASGKWNDTTENWWPRLLVLVMFRLRLHSNGLNIPLNLRQDGPLEVNKPTTRLSSDFSSFPTGLLVIFVPSWATFWSL